MQRVKVQNHHIFITKIKNINYTIENRKFNITIRTSIIIVKIISLYNDFIRKINLSQRKSSYLPQPLCDDEKINIILSFIRQYIKEKYMIYDINDKFNLIDSCDETPL